MGKGKHVIGEMRMKNYGFPKKMPLISDRPAFASPGDWAKAVQQEMDRYRKTLRREPKQGGINVVEEYDYTEAMCKRRERAIVDTVPEICTRFGKDGALANTLAYQWISLNMTLGSYSIMDAQSHILFGASLWILDRITEQEGWQEIFHCLPQDDRAIEDLFVPEVWDCQYEYDLISSVESVLHYRNSDAGGVEEDTAGHERVLTSDLATRGVITAEGKSRQQYKALMGMIPQEHIETAVNHFLLFFWQWVNRTFACFKLLSDDMEDVKRRINRTVSQFNQAIDDGIRAMNDVEKKANEMRGKPNPLLAKPEAPMESFVSSFSPSSLGSPFLQPPCEILRTASDVVSANGRINQLGEHINDLADELHTVEQEEQHFMFRIVREGRISREEDKEKYGKRDPDAIEAIRISDPYELCFALLWLIEEDSNIPWLYGACMGFMSEVAEALPWGIFEYIEEDDEIWNEEYDEESPPLPKSVVIPDWYERKYRLRGDEFDYPRSLAQIVYEETGCILPRDLHMYDRYARELFRYGIKGKDAAGILTLMSGLGFAKRQINARNFESGLGSLLDGKEESCIPEQEQEQNQPDAQSEQLREEIKKLRAALHASERAARDIKKELASVRETAVREHRELADLREVVFNREECIEEEETIPSGEWPYNVQKDTVIFGGHATWAKGIKGLLIGNIRFIDKDLVFDIGIVRHAEVIWIQPNALSHPMYWRIVDTARIHGKPVRYFAFASWAKCAEQVKENDEK